MDTIEPSSATISEPGGMRPVRGRRAAGWCSPRPGHRRCGARWWRSGRWRCRTPGRPTPGRRRPGPGSCPVPAGPVTTSTVRAEVSTCQTAAAWSSRSPRGVACSRASCARPRSCASSSAASAPRRRAASSPGSRGAPLRLRVRDQLLLSRQLRGGGVPRGARPRVDAAPVQLAAQRRRAAAATPAPPGTPPPRSARTGPPRPGRAAAPAPPAGSSAGSPAASPGRAA